MSGKQLKAVSVISLIMELILGCQKHSEKSQLALSNARLESVLGKSSLTGQLPKHSMGETTPVLPLPSTIAE